MAEIFDLDIVDANNTARFPEGMLGSSINNAARALEGLLARWYEDTDGSITSSGSANAYAITSKRTIAALTNNTVMAFTANFANTGAATLAFNGLTAKSIKRPNGDALVANDIVSGQVCIVIYKSSPDEWRLLSPPGKQQPPPARAYAERTTVFTTTQVIAIDDSIPQSSEGDELMTVSMPALNRADSRVRIKFKGYGEFDSVVAAGMIFALFKDSETDARATAIRMGTNLDDSERDRCNPIVLDFEFAPGAVTAATYKIRCAMAAAGTLTVLGFNGARKFGGTMRATLIAEEVYV